MNLKPAPFTFMPLVKFGVGGFQCERIYPTSPVSSDGRVRAPKARPNLYDLLRQIENSDDDVSRRVAQAACDSDTSGSDHAADDEDGSDSDSEVSMRCEFVDSMAAESRSVQSDEGATSADSDACARE